MRLRYLAEVNPPVPELDLLDADDEVTFVPLEDVWPGSDWNPSQTRPKSVVASGYTRFREGDVLLPKIHPTFQADRSTVATGLPRGFGAGTTELHVIRARPNVDARYISYLVSTKAFLEVGEAEMVGVAGQKRVPTEFLLDYPVPATDVHRQQAIADFLDTETARIDALIAKKRHMMDLVKDRLAACIRRAVSEGLTSSELRQTDVAVVPRLPVHWELTRARFVCRVETGAGDTVQAMEDGDYPFFVRSDTVERSDEFLFDTEAVLTAGDGAGVAKVFHHYSGKFNAHQRVYVMHEFRRVLGRYYYYCLRTLFPLVALDGSAKSTVDSVRRHMLTDMPVPLPPLEEQAQIVRALDREVARADRMLGALEKHLQLLNEHRQALVTAAVTGEFEVPGVAA